MFVVQIKISRNQWRDLCSTTNLHLAGEICSRASMSDKVTARVLEEAEIVYETFYNQADDPDHYEREDFSDLYHEDDVDLRWQEVGF